MVTLAFTAFTLLPTFFLTGFSSSEDSESLSKSLLVVFLFVFIVSAFKGFPLVTFPVGFLTAFLGGSSSSDEDSSLTFLAGGVFLTVLTVFLVGLVLGRSSSDSESESLIGL